VGRGSLVSCARQIGLKHLAHNVREIRSRGGDVYVFLQEGDQILYATLLSSSTPWAAGIDWRGKWSSARARSGKGKQGVASQECWGMEWNAGLCWQQRMSIRGRWWSSILAGSD
jgi:hypothetical protein